MKEYTLIYKNKRSEQIAATGKQDLIDTYFQGDHNLFKKEVSQLMWNEISMQCIMDVSSGKIQSEIFTADVNPYGWRDARG